MTLAWSSVILTSVIIDVRRHFINLFPGTSVATSTVVTTDVTTTGSTSHGGMDLVSTTTTTTTLVLVVVVVVVVVVVIMVVVTVVLTHFAQSSKMGTVTKGFDVRLANRRFLVFDFRAL